MARKRKSKPTKKKRSAPQRLKDRYAHAREDAQLAGIIPTTPEEALTSERVDPRLQSEQRFPDLDRLAIRGGHGFDVTEPVRRKIIEVNAEMLYEKRIEFIDGPDGDKIAIEVPNRKLQLEASKNLLAADEMQYKRDEPARAGQAAGADQVQVIDLKAILEQVSRQREAAEQINILPAADAMPSNNGHSTNGDGK